jgi:hypothetical protein
MGQVKDEYDSPYPGLNIKLKGHRHSNRCRPLVTIAEKKPFDADALAAAVATFVWQNLSPVSRATLEGHQLPGDEPPKSARKRRPA